MIWIVEYSVLLLESDAFQNNSWLSVEFVSLLWKQGKCCQFYPPTKKKQPAPLPLPCSALQWLQTALEFFPVLLWTDCSYFRCKMDCGTSCTHSCMGRFFFTFFFFPHLQKWTFSVRCLCSPGLWDFPWQLLLLLAEGFPLIHCDQLKLTAKMSSFFLLDLASLCWQLGNSGLQQWDF